MTNAIDRMRRPFVAETPRNGVAAAKNGEAPLVPLPRGRPATGCAMRDKGVEIRDLCVDCNGRPRCGQHQMQKRAPLYLEGEPAEAVFVVLEGYVRETRTMVDGRAQGIRLVGPGDLAGTEALTSRTYFTSAEALTNVSACRAPVAQVQQHLKGHPVQALNLIGELGAELKAVRESVLWLGTLSAEERVLAMLRQLTGNAPKGVMVHLPITRLDISEFLGLAHATVSRVIQRLARKGVIDVRGRWITFL